MNVLVKRTGLPLLGLTMATCLLWAGPAPAPAAEPAPACSSALQLARAGLPQRSISMLQAAGGQVIAQCAEVWAEASALVGTAALQAEEAKAAASQEDDDSAQQLAESALDSDHENAVAAKVLADLAAKQAKQPTWVETLGTNFENFTQKYLTPGGDLVAAILLALASLLLAARVVPLLVTEWPVLMGTWPRSLVFGGGVVAAAVACSLTAVTVASWSPNDHGGGWGLAIGIATAGALAVGLLGWWLATRLRVAVDAHKGSEADASTAAHVAALLSDLGAAPPRGLEVPTGADAAELGNALASIPGAGSWVTKLGQFLAGLAGATPWRVDIAAVESDSLAVRMSRNGHPMGSVVIHPTDGRRPEEDAKVPPEDLQRLAAAYALTVLSRHHGTFPGLAGASDWRSLGLHYIATTDLRGQAQVGQQQETLARAVDLDPGNMLAVLAWQHAKWRISDKAEELTLYLNWLTAFLRPPSQPAQRATEETAPVKLRAAYTRAAVALNLRCLRADAGVLAPDPEHSYVAAYQDFQKRLRDASPSGPGTPDPLICQMTDVLNSLPPPSYTQAKRSFAPPAPGQATPTTPRGIYNLACWHASSDPADPTRAVELLKQVTSIPDYLDWMGKDPQLSALRKLDEYRDAFGADPRTDLYDLPQMAPHAAILKSSGFGNAAVLAEAAHDASSRLVRLLPADSLATVTGLAEVHERLQAQKALAPTAVEILSELAERGLASTHAMRDYPHWARQAASEQIHTNVAERCKPRMLSAKDLSPFTAELIKSWWNVTYR